MEFFSANIKYLREKKGLKQSELCAITGFKQSTWSGYEKGTSKPNFGDLLKIIEFFEVSSSELLEYNLSDVHLNEKSDNRNDGNNVHLKVRPTVHLNDKKGNTEPCPDCTGYKEVLKIKDELIDSLRGQIRLLEQQSKHNKQ